MFKNTIQFNLDILKVKTNIMKLIFSLTLIVVSFAANIPTEKLKYNWKSYLKVSV